MIATHDPACFLHVAVGVIFDHANQVLITRRSLDAHQGGKWEFPGGKVESGESTIAALHRELEEELGIIPLSCLPLIKIRHDYPDKRVLLDVWQVDGFAGEPNGRESQPLRWVAQDKMKEFQFPEANLPILTAILLPSCYLFTPDPGENWASFLSHLEEVLRGGVGLVRFRAHSLCDDDYQRCARQVIKLAHHCQAKVLIDRRPEWVELLGADGIHLDSRSLRQLKCRPLIRTGLLVGASCHHLGELKCANQIQADFVVVSPVKATRSHPGRAGLGWRQFTFLCDGAAMPVFALGGTGPEDVSRVRHCGGQGIAAIRSLWQTEVVE
jgi:8-oxo-dGTP diphosphatase